MATSWYSLQIPKITNNISLTRASLSTFSIWQSSSIFTYLFSNFLSIKNITSYFTIKAEISLHTFYMSTSSAMGKVLFRSPVLGHNFFPILTLTFCEDHLSSWAPSRLGKPLPPSQPPQSAAPPGTKSPNRDSVATTTSGMAACRNCIREGLYTFSLTFPGSSLPPPPCPPVPTPLWLPVPLPTVVSLEVILFQSTLSLWIMTACSSRAGPPPRRRSSMDPLLESLAFFTFCLDLDDWILMRVISFDEVFGPYWSSSLEIRVLWGPETYVHDQCCQKN
jgi:hypothetical protein